MQYKVRFHRDETYAVYLLNESDEDGGYNNVLFAGSLADCEAYIRLREGGYLDD